MKKRNKYYLKEKDFLRLRSESIENSEAQRNLGWVELDEPIHSGFTAFLTLRNDVSNREDAWVFQSLIDNFGTTSYARKIKEFNFFNKSNLYQVYNKPHINEINEYTYNSLLPQIKKWFTKTTLSYSSWRGNYYYCNVPDFYFEIKIEKRWITKMRIFDEVLQQEEAEIDAEIKRKYYGLYYKHSSVPKSFRKCLNRSQRAKSKRILYNIFFKEKDFEFEDNYKSASWLFW